MGTSVPSRPSSCSCSWGYQLCRTDTSCLFFVPIFKSASFPLSGPLTSKLQHCRRAPPTTTFRAVPPTPPFNPLSPHANADFRGTSRQSPPSAAPSTKAASPLPHLLPLQSQPYNGTMCHTPAHHGVLPITAHAPPSFWHTLPGFLPHHPSLSHPRHWAQPPLAMLLCLCPCPAPRWRHQSTH